MRKNSRVLLFLFMAMTLWGCSRTKPVPQEPEVTVSELETDTTKAAEIELTINGESVGEQVEDWRRLYGDDQELYELLFKREIHEKEREAIRKELITQYVEANDLEIEGYQDYGWEPIMLFE